MFCYPPMVRGSGFGAPQNPGPVRGIIHIAVEFGIVESRARHLIPGGFVESPSAIGTAAAVPDGPELDVVAHNAIHPAGVNSLEMIKVAPLPERVVEAHGPASIAGSGKLAGARIDLTHPGEPDALVLNIALTQAMKEAGMQLGIRVIFHPFPFLFSPGIERQDRAVMRHHFDSVTVTTFCNSSNRLQ